MFKLNVHDLEFVLKQIKIGEANANGADLTEIRVDPTTGDIITDPAAYANGVFVGNATYPLTNADGPILYVRAIPDPQTPFGIRTVDGTYNNLIEGQETWAQRATGCRACSMPAAIWSITMATRSCSEPEHQARRRSTTETTRRAPGRASASARWLTPIRVSFRILSPT